MRASRVALAPLRGHDWVHLLRGRFRRFRFRRQAHDRLSLAVVVRGVVRVQRPGGSDDALPGDVVTVHAGDVHRGGGPRDEGRHIRTVPADEDVPRERAQSPFASARVAEASTR